MISGDSQYSGHSLAAGTSTIMTLAMGSRLIKTGKFMPAGKSKVIFVPCVSSADFCVSDTKLTFIFVTQRNCIHSCCCKHGISCAESIGMERVRC